MASSSSGPVFKYDVFLNFRGDVRKSFVSHLHRALDKKPIKAFIDAEDLRKGDDLTELLTSIEQSRVSIVVFSEDYVSSKWCLKELVHIIKCKDIKKQIVVPIFYQVDPSDIRNLKRQFDRQAFPRHERPTDADIKEVESWSSALKKAANIDGWDSRKGDDDATFIDKIVEDIHDKLNYVSYKASGLVEIDFHIDKMKYYLCTEEEDVRVIGIWGMGGIGKTTIAKAVYEEIKGQFRDFCFLENVKEGFMKQGAVSMLKQLLSRILKERERSFVTLNRSSKKVMESLRSRRVLVVLDDVDNLAQIETLLGTDPHSFGVRSRIIITTRNRELLSGVDAIYSPELFSHYRARELFKQYAFRTQKSESVYHPLLNRAIEYARGLPLALKVLGAFLDNKSVSEWAALLEKTKNIPHMGIQDVLKTSFDGLDDSEKEIFLDIACFFKGTDKSYASKILEGCGFFPHVGLKVLVDRALVIISDRNTLEMHDSLMEMGREIVRQESTKEPGRRSRLWRYEDVLHVLTQNTATEAVESITLDLSNPREACGINSEAFVKMKNLRLLKIESYNHSWHDLKFPSGRLSWLIWHRCPLTPFPSNFYTKKLVNIDMQHSQIQQLWEGTKPLQKLEVINLSYSKGLTETPDMTEARNLEKVILDGCVSLSQVHSSISFLENLVYLSLKGCTQLEIFPTSLSMKSLQTLNLSGCSNLETFPEISEVMKVLSELYLDETAIRKLSPSINHLSGLVKLSLKSCSKLESLTHSICMSSLRTLVLSGCSKFNDFPEVSETMDKLSELYLDETAIQGLPSSIRNLKSLATLNLNGCRALATLPRCIPVDLNAALTMSGCSMFRQFT